MEQKVEIYDIIRALDNCKNDVNIILKKLKSEPLAEREAEFKPPYSMLQEILIRIGVGLFEAAQKVTKKKDLVFYFWPGYTSINNDRVPIRGQVNKFDKEDEKYFTGIGFIGSANNRFFDCPSTLYFDAVLSANPNLKKYIPPTTHHWKVQQQDNGLDIKLKEDDSNLKILLIEKSNTKAAVVSKNKTILHVKFNETEVGNCIEEIAKFLETDSDSLSLNPSDKKSKYIPWPLNKWYDKEECEIVNEEDLEAAQRIIYPIWFAATFCDTLHNYDQKYGESNWLNGVKEKLNQIGYPELTQRINAYQKAEANHFKDENYYDVHFTHWYSLFFDNYDAKQELGSAMFLTNEKLPEEFLYYVSSWLKFIYSQIRALDYATLIQQKTKKEEWENVIQQMRHNIITHLSYLPKSNNEEERNFIVGDIIEYLRLTKYMNSDLAIKEYVNNELNSVDNKNISIKKDIISPIVQMIQTVIENNSIILGGSPMVLTALKKNATSAFEYDNTGDDYQIKAVKSIARLVFKDIITNAIKNTNPKEPKCIININCSNSVLQVTVKNNRSISKDYYEQINSPDDKLPKVPGHWGIFIYKNFTKYLGWKLNCLSNSIDENLQETTIIIEIPLSKN